MGIPLLYPWANRLEGMRLHVAGREVVLDRISPPLRLDDNGLPMHGLLAGVSGWQVERHEPHGDGAVLAARFDLAAHPDLAGGVPVPARAARSTHTWSGRRSRSRRPSSPHGDSPVPVAFGYHPYFALPACRGRSGRSPSR